MTGPFYNHHRNDPNNVTQRPGDVYSGGVPAPGVPPGLGLGHGHASPGQNARPPVTDFLGNVALQQTVNPSFPQPRWK